METNQQEQHLWVVEQLVQNPNLRFDKEWRMNHLYWINTKDGAKRVFKMNRAQKHFFDNYLNIADPTKKYYRHIVLKSRQLGFTTFFALFILDEILFSTNKDAMFIAHKLKNAQEIFDSKVYFAIRNMAPDIKDALFKINRNSMKKVQITIEEGPNAGSTSNIQVDVSGRSSALHFVHLSEFAKMCVIAPESAKEVITGTFPAVPFDGMVFIESTAEGMSGAFYDIFNSGWRRRAKITPMMSRVEFLPHFYNWTWDDEEMKKITEIIPTSEMEECEIPWKEYQEEHGLTDKEITYYYMKYLQQQRDIHKLRQEFPTTAEEAFVSSGQTYFPTTRVVSMMQSAGKGKRGELSVLDGGEVKFQEISNGELEVFHLPEKGVRYVIGGDTAEGLSHGDEQVLVVVNAKTELIVAVWRSKVPPDQAAEMAYSLGKFYNYALLAVESNKDGLWVNSQLEKMGYHNLYYRRVFDDVTKVETKFFGWRTTSSTRPFMLVSLRSAFMRLGWFPEGLLYQMLKFVRNMKGRPEAMSGEHDDVVMASAIAYSVLAEKGKQQEDPKTDNPTLTKTMWGESDVVVFDQIML